MERNDDRQVVFSNDVYGNCGTHAASEGGKLLRCGTCRVKSYCSRACRKQHWRMHKGDCRAVPPLPELDQSSSKISPAEEVGLEDGLAALKVAAPTVD